jgi:hypothetical protein
MYCSHCGKEVTDKAVVCSGCGTPLNEGAAGATGGEPWRWFTIASLVVLTAFVPPAGLVFGYIGLSDPGKKVQGAVLMTMGVFMTVLMIAVIAGL